MIAAALGGTARHVVDLWKRGFLQLVVSEEVVKEYLAVLARFNLTDAQMRHWARWFIHPSKVTEVQPPMRFAASRDPKDNPFLDAAVTGRAVYLITRDKDLLVLMAFEGVQILTPAEFISLWQPPRPKSRPRRKRKGKRK